MRIKLTAANIGKHKRGYLWDAVTPGLGLRKWDKGSHWCFRFMWEGSQRQKKLGPFPGLSLEDARRLAVDNLNMIATGACPATDRAALHRIGLTVGELCARYIEEYCSRRNKTWKNTQSIINAHVLPRWASLPVVELTRQEVRSAHRELVSSPYAANRFLAFISKLWSWGLANDLLPNVQSPTVGVERYKEESRSRWVSREEMPRLVKAIEAEPDAYVRAAFWTLLLTGMRKGEVRSMRWKWIDRARRRVCFPASAVKSGKRQEVPFPASLLVKWDGARLADPDCPFVFRGSGRRMIALDRYWKRIREAAALEDVHIHDLRRTFGSWLREYQGENVDLIQDILRHSDPKTTRIYAHLGDDRSRDAVDSFASLLLPEVSDPA